jgi:hypothetical protein
LAEPLIQLLEGTVDCWRDSHRLLNSDDLVSLVSDNTGTALRLVNTAVRYWAAYPSEVDAEIAAADAAEEAAEQAWLRERQLLAG